MAKNKLSDLNDHLFEMMERLNDDTLMEEHGEKEINRAKAMSDIGKTIIENGKLVLEAQKHADEFGYGSRGRKMPDLLESKVDED
mgnify:CR=1 FL=1